MLCNFRLNFRLYPLNSEVFLYAEYCSRKIIKTKHLNCLLLQQSILCILIMCLFQVKAILVNVVGGIVNCATIASGILNACEQIKLKLPLVVRLEGKYHAFVSGNFTFGPHEIASRLLHLPL